MIPLPPVRPAALASEYGGELEGMAGATEIVALASLDEARQGSCAGSRGCTLVPVFRAAELEKLPYEVVVLAGAGIDTGSRPTYRHTHASFVLAKLLARALVELPEPELGVGVKLGQNVVLERGVRIGDRCEIGHGAVIGARGFGWVPSPDGAMVKMPHLGGVVLEADVSLGSLVTVDAGVMTPTRIGARTKLDAHCHVGHNVVIGSDCFVAAQSGFAGSVRVGSRVRIGGQVGVADHVTIGDGAEIAAKSGVIGDVQPKSIVAGYPARPRVEWLRAVAKELRAEPR